MNENLKQLIGTTLEFKRTISRGRDTYGYNICSLYVQGKKVASCNGGGYDMQGTVLADWMKKNMEEELKTIPSNRGSLDTNVGFYGLTFYNEAKSKWEHKYSEGCSVGLDGACGVSSMERILNHFGLRLEYVPVRSKNLSIMVVRELKK